MKQVILIMLLWLSLVYGFGLTQDKEVKFRFQQQKDVTPNDAFTGKYINQLGSSLWIDWIKYDQLAFGGRYSTGAGQPQKDQVFKVSGTFQFISKEISIISWTVNWEDKSKGKNYHSVTAWNGFVRTISDGSAKIYANWLLNHLDPEDSQKWTLFDLIQSTTGSDIFTRQ